jgi:hypothetical protein
MMRAMAYTCLRTSLFDNCSSNQCRGLWGAAGEVVFNVGGVLSSRFAACPSDASLTAGILGPQSQPCNGTKVPYSSCNAEYELSIAGRGFCEG